MTDYTEVELGGDEVAEESPGRCIEMHTENASVVAVLSGQTAVKEGEMITVKEHVELPKDPENNSEEERRVCEKSTQYDVSERETGPSTTVSDSSGSIKAERVGADWERQNKEFQGVTQTSVCQVDVPKHDVTHNKDTSSALTSKEQAVPVRRGRGRPRKSAVSPEVVQNGRQGKQLVAEKAAEKK